jgi:hypothetical protein
MPVRARLFATATIACLSLWSLPLAVAAGPELRLPSFEHLQRPRHRFLGPEPV